MRAILRANDHTSHLWIETGEVFELPDLTDPEVARARRAADEVAAARRTASAPPPAAPAKAATTPAAKAAKAPAGKAAQPAKAAPKPAPAAKVGPKPAPARVRVPTPPAKARIEPTGPTDEGGPGAEARRARADELEDLATDEVSKGTLLRLVRPPPVPPVQGTAPDSLPPLGPLERERTGPKGVPEVPPRFAKLDDEMSTGLFEPMGWDEADPCSAVPESEPEPVRPAARPVAARPSAHVLPATPPPAPARAATPAPPPARLSVVQRAAVDEDFSGVVATPLPAPPRPVGPASMPPALRAAAEVPDWYDAESNGTLVVLDPTRRRFHWTFWTCVAADLAAWAAGFAITFAVGAVGSATALGVAIATAT